LSRNVIPLAGATVETLPGPARGPQASASASPDWRLRCGVDRRRLGRNLVEVKRNGQNAPTDKAGVKNPLEDRRIAPMDRGQLPRSRDLGGKASCSGPLIPTASPTRLRHDPTRCALITLAIGGG
jgi:hypothetical protein